MKRSNFEVMRRLIGMVGPLWSVMVLAVFLGVLGNLCAILIPVLGGIGLLGGSYKTLLIVLPVLALMRGVLHYVEQNRNHYLAFTILALVRDRVFGALRRLAPAKLEGKEKGDLIAVLTADIELLEVFYAHTISPICIAFFVSLFMVIFLHRLHPFFACIGFVSYAVVGIVIPMMASKKSAGFGAAFRKEFGELDGFVLDSLRGLRESIQFNGGKKRLEDIYRHADILAEKEHLLKGAGGWNAALTEGVILCLDLLMFFAAAWLYSHGNTGFEASVLAVVALMSSFGPVIALASLGTGLQNTLAAGNRVLDILEEEPLIEEVKDGKDIVFHSLACDHVDFSYDGDEQILKDFSLSTGEGEIIGLSGKSGSGKSTLLKLIMRFFDADRGTLHLSGVPIKEINTSSLRDNESYVTQDTILFHDSIEENLRIAKPDATKEEMEEACRKAAVHDFIMSLPDGYQTSVGELGETLSGGERQRIGLARTFLHDAPLVLLDEPTSNLDSLNEAEILKSIQDFRSEKTILLVSHRASTMCIADRVYKVENGRMS